MREYIIIIVAYLIWRVIQLSRRHKWRSSIRHELGLALFVLSLVVIASLTVFPPYVYGSRLLNLRIFEAVRRAWREWTLRGSLAYFYSNVIGNLILLIPVGFFVPLLFRVRPWHAVLYGFGTSLVIEIIQYPLGRWSDVDDLWLNTLGALIGMLLVLGLRAVAPRFTDGFRVK